MEKGSERKGREKELEQNTQSIKWLGLHASSVRGCRFDPQPGDYDPTYHHHNNKNGSMKGPHIEGKRGQTKGYS